MLGNVIRNHVQKRDEHAMLAPLREDLQGYEEPEDIREVMNYSEPYLPSYGALGEMVLNIGKTIYLQKKGAHGVIDISPFHLHERDHFGSDLPARKPRPRRHSDPQFLLRRDRNRP